MSFESALDQILEVLLFRSLIYFFLSSSLCSPLFLGFQALLCFVSRVFPTFYLPEVHKSTFAPPLDL